MTGLERVESAPGSPKGPRSTGAGVNAEIEVAVPASQQLVSKDGASSEDAVSLIPQYATDN